MIAASCLSCGNRAPPRAPRCDACGFVFFEERARRRIGRPGPLSVVSVRCRRAIRTGGSTRCQVRYANGDTQLILVGLDGRGELDITVPYPAQRRPGG